MRVMVIIKAIQDTEAGVLPVPELTARVIDQTATLDAIQRQGLQDIVIPRRGPGDI